MSRRLKFGCGMLCPCELTNRKTMAAVTYMYCYLDVFHVSYDPQHEDESRRFNQSKDGAV